MDKIQLIGGGRPAIPEGFREQLRKLDPTLLVRWNDPPPWSKRPPRFVIEQCVKHLAPTAEHTHICERIYVFLVQDEEGNMAQLGDWVLDEIKRRDVSREGFGPGDLQRFNAMHQSQLEDYHQGIERKQRESVKHCRQDNRRQLLKAINLIQQCDPFRVHQ